MCVKKNTNKNDDNEVNNDRVKEHLSSTDIVVNSESRGNDLVQLSGLKEISTSDVNNIQDEEKDTDNDKEQELSVTGDNTNNNGDDKIIAIDDMNQNNSEEFDNSDGGMISNNDRNNDW